MDKAPQNHTVTTLLAERLRLQRDKADLGPKLEAAKKAYDERVADVAENERQLAEVEAGLKSAGYTEPPKEEPKADTNKVDAKAPVPPVKPGTSA